MKLITDEELEAQRQRGEAIIFRSKWSACFCVAGTALCTLSVSVNTAFYGLAGDLFLIAMWTASYLVISAVLASNQRLVMIQQLVEAKDVDGIMRFSLVPGNVHLLAVLVFDDPYKLYGRRRP